MYSQCPNCQAIFSVSETDIGAHRGLVRCGRCSSVFHALTNEVDAARVQSREWSQPPGRGAGADDDPVADAPDATVDASYPGAPPAPGTSSGQGREESEGEGFPDVQEERGWDVRAPALDAAHDDHEEALIEPVLPRPPATANAASADPRRDDRQPEAPQQEAPQQEAPQQEAPQQEAPKQEAPKQEAPKQEAPKQEEPKQEEPKQEEPKQEEPKQEEPKQEEPKQEEPKQEEPSRDEPALEAALQQDDTNLPGEIIEEITIEAPPVLWNAFDDDLEEEAGRDESTAAGRRDGPGADRAAAGPGPGAKRARSGKATASREPGADTAGVVPGRRTPPRSPYREHDVRMVELPKPRPFKTATLSLLAVLLALLAIWQAKTFYLDQMAQVTVLRPYLELACRPLGCVLPPRRDFARINLVGTSIDVNPEFPGALEITASLINRAGFPQPYPPLRVTLTDREGRVVGRRTYLPSEYRDGEGLLPTREVSDVAIKLAQPSESAVGYEVELMAPVRDSGG